jgi:UDP-N-acetylmuramoyl-tripeptide--D-alanyl-D-alanine ligase
VSYQFNPIHPDLIRRIYEIFRECGKVSTDTRKITEGSVFFALRGDNFDGNEYAHKALELGASYAVVDSPWFTSSENFIKVPDVLSCLQQVAVMHRSNLNVSVIGITGSNGKTTTKELMKSVLMQQFNVLATEGNLNNHIGVPLTLLKLTREHTQAIIEMGASSIGEIKQLCSFARPDIGYITNFGKAHLEGFGSEEAVIRGKSELYEDLRNGNGVAIVNGNDKKQMKATRDISRFVFGEKDADCKITLGTPIDGNLVINVEGTDIRSNLTGTYNLSNIAAAAALGCYLKVPLQSIQKGIAAYVPENNRSQWLIMGSNKILLDAYNANPSSVEVALQSLSELPGKKWVIIGDMFELGHYARQEHQRIARLANELDFDKVLLVGENFYNINGVENVQTFANIDLLRKFLESEQIENTTILLKGSRGMKMESLLNIFS